MKLKEIDGIVEFINKTYSANCKKILITGSGVHSLQNHLENFYLIFKIFKLAELKSVQLITNGKQ